MREIVVLSISLLFACCGSSTDPDSGTQPPCEQDCIEDLSVSLNQLQDFLGGKSGVLVWVNTGGQIEVLEFSPQQANLRKLSTDIDCINPLLSPDGTRVIYSQGSPNGSKIIFVRSLDGQQVNNLGSGDVGYWHFGDGDETIVHCDWSEKAENGASGKTYQTKLVQGGVESQGDSIQIHDRAMDAGPNADLVWLGQVYEHLWAYNLSTQTDYPNEKFYLLNGDPADHQSCNGSMAPDSTGRLMSLVIPHDYIRVYTHDTASDSFLQTSEFELPEGMAEWGFPEWSTNSNYFTAVLRGSDLQNNLFIVKMTQGVQVPKRLQIADGKHGAKYSHLYLAP